MLDERQLVSTKSDICSSKHNARETVYVSVFDTGTESSSLSPTTYASLPACMLSLSCIENEVYTRGRVVNDNTNVHKCPYFIV